MKPGFHVSGEFIIGFYPGNGQILFIMKKLILLNYSIQILKEERLNYLDGLHGVVHCFGGNLKQAKEILDLNLYIGFTGIVTFDKTGKLDEIIKSVPIERILIETDSPYLTPAPYRGKRNEPSYVKRVAEYIAKIKNLTIYEVEKQTTKNAIELFKLRY